MKDARRVFRYETGRHLWLVLEYCVGGDLKSLLEKDRQLPEDSIHDFACGLVASLQYCHSQVRAVVHPRGAPCIPFPLGRFSARRRAAPTDLQPLCSCIVVWALRKALAQTGGIPQKITQCGILGTNPHRSSCRILTADLGRVEMHKWHLRQQSGP